MNAAVKRISTTPIYAQTVRYVDKLPPWPKPPELAYSLYRITSPHWNGVIKVRQILLDNFGEARAVPFTLWGKMLAEWENELEQLFAKHGRHEVRKRFVEAVQFERIA